jgi:hypothetical protein
MGLFLKMMMHMPIILVLHLLICFTTVERTAGIGEISHSIGGVHPSERVCVVLWGFAIQYIVMIFINF